MAARRQDLGPGGKYWEAGGGGTAWDTHRPSTPSST